MSLLDRLRPLGPPGELAPGLRIARGVPGLPLLNVYLLGADAAGGGVLLDSGVRGSGRVLVPQLASHRVAAHALTHAHVDHAGSSAWLCSRLDVPLWVGAGDAEGMRTGRVDTHSWTPFRSVARLSGVAPREVDRALVEGDVVGGFEVLEVPGHSPGALAFWRARDRVLLAGDVLTNSSPLPGRPRLRQPPPALSHDPARNAEALRRLVELRPRVVGFGHGHPVTDPGRFADAVSAALA